MSPEDEADVWYMAQKETPGTEIYEELERKAREREKQQQQQTQE